MVYDRGEVWWAAIRSRTELFLFRRSHVLVEGVGSLRDHRSVEAALLVPEIAMLVRRRESRRDVRLNLCAALDPGVVGHANPLS